MKASLLALTMFCTTFAQADESRGWELGVKSGVVFGRVTSDFADPDNPGLEIKGDINYGGLPIGISASFPTTTWLTLSPSLEGVLDVGQGSVSRKGIALDGEFQIVGERDSTHGISLLSRIAYQSYSPTSSATAPLQVDGEALEGNLGAQYRLALSKDTSLSLSVMHSVFTLAMSIPKIFVNNTTAELGCRISL